MSYINQPFVYQSSNFGNHCRFQSRFGNVNELCGPRLNSANPGVLWQVSVGDSSRMNHKDIDIAVNVLTEGRITTLSN